MRCGLSVVLVLLCGLWIWCLRMMVWLCGWIAGLVRFGVIKVGKVVALIVL